MFDLEFDGETDKSLVQRCVDKGLFDEDFLQKSIDMELNALGRRVINKPRVPMNETFVNDQLIDEAQAKRTELEALLRELHSQ